MHIIYPNVCAFCGEVMEFNKAGLYICSECMEKVDFCANKECCRICGTPLNNERYNRCDECYNKLRNKIPIYYERIASVCEYNENSKPGILRYKKSGIPAVMNTYAALIQGTVLSNFDGVEFDLVVAVPPRADRMKEIGFDQSHYLAKRTAKRMNVKYVRKGLKRVRKTEKQTSLNQHLRQQNLAGAFEFVKSTDLVRNKTVLVIDDVTTTGATIDECARALRAAGADKVYGATIATTAGNSEG